ncbi:MAG: response regulator [Eubacterium sp.]|nr:response regulator [Eubacterium sp.]
MDWKVLIADDDRNFRYAMCEAIPWKEHGFEVAAEAVHGRQALEILRDKEIHIVLTDMEMPVMNGVELTEAVKKQYPEIIVVALSAYDDFEFVKESMRLGAEDYILKQEFDGEKIIQMLEHLCAQNLEKRRKDFNQGRENEAFLAYLQGKLDVPAQGSPYYKLLDKDHMTLCLAQSASAFEMHVRNDGNLLFFGKAKEHVWLFIYQMPQTRSKSQWMQEQLCMAGDVQSGFSGNVRIALCDESGGFFKLPGMYAKAETALQYAVYFPKERMLHYLDISRYEKTRKRDYVYDLPEHRLSVQQETGERILMEMGERLKENMPEEEFVNGSFVNFYKEFLAGSTAKVDDMEVIKYYEGLKQWISVEDKMDYTSACMEKWRRQMLAAYNGKHKSIRKAIEYVYKHYAEDVSLQDIAVYVGLSDNYLSNLFKKEMNENLVSFINKVRIQKAKKLLENQNLKVNEIAEAVGFHNATYLSTMFKKVTGMSISEYKSQSAGLSRFS